MSEKLSHCILDIYFERFTDFIEYILSSRFQLFLEHNVSSLKTCMNFRVRKIRSANLTSIITAM